MSRFSKIDKDTAKSLVALVLLGALGLAVAFIGYSLGDGNWGVLKFVVVALGIGSFAGALSQLISRISEAWFGNKILESLRELVKARILSNESDLSDIRRPLYLYYKSEYDKKPLWRCVELDFSDSKHPGSATAHVDIKHPNGKDIVHYSFDAAIRTHTLVLLSERSGEAAAELVFPTYKKKIGNDHNFGLTFHENWDQQQTIDPAVILTSPKYPIDTLGLLSEADGAEIEKEWLTRFFLEQGRGIPRKLA